MTTLSSILIGNESLLLRCAALWRERGHTIAAVVTRNPEIRAWAEAEGLRVLAPEAGAADGAAPASVDWVLSIANLALVPAPLLGAARLGAINFHDGPLPAHAGLNAPVWALLAGETRHAVSWHLIAGGIDEGDVIVERAFDIAPDETALTLNTRCWEAAIESFADLVLRLEAGGVPAGRRQDLARRRYHARADRPAAAARIDFGRGAAAVAAFVRALDHGPYWNPLARAKIVARGRVLLVGQAAVEARAPAIPGTVLEATPAGLVVAAAGGAVRLTGLADPAGAPVCPSTVAAAGEVIASPAVEEAGRLDAALAAVVAGEGRWRRRLAALAPLGLPGLAPPADSPRWETLAAGLPADLDPGLLVAAFAAWAARVAGKPAADLAFRAAAAPAAPGYLSHFVPLAFAPAAGESLGAAAARLAGEIAAARRWPAFAADLPARDPAIGVRPVPEVAIAEDGPVAGSAVTLVTGRAPAVWVDAARADAVTRAAWAESLSALVAAAAALPATAVENLPLLTPATRRRVLAEGNATALQLAAETTVHAALAAQAARTPAAIALAFEGESLTYADLEARANRLAHVLVAEGVGPGSIVGLCLPRGPDLVAGALAILKAGGAYLPLDPAYPADRLAFCLEDAGAGLIVTDRARAAPFLEGSAGLVLVDAEPRLATLPATAPEGRATAADLAYVIYTSGSTGRPKGVMVEHGSVINFFAGMDARIPHDPPGVWLAVTSLSFDIAVLELFWTLARGFKVVLSGEEERALVARHRLPLARRKMEFSLYYWGNDDGVGRDKYRLLLEGARFADSHGFRAIWTPERHFHAFGGPYPNPAVTGAAVAAVTRNLDVRSGSVVAPLHHPLRIAEEWAVIDNLTNGRAGLGIASGWHPEDFVLKPENAPPANKAAMYAAIDQVRRLWRGEKVSFPWKPGQPVEVLTQPRPVSRELPVWLTIAGNPDTWREAGEIGAHVLTHLLGQSIEEVGEKIKLYRATLARHGHDPAKFTVTLMLHTFVARDREQARRTARGPMRAYLGAAAGLVRQYAWTFPAFKKPQGVASPADIDLRTLGADEVDAILEFAFTRYFEDSGLFGTVEDALDRVEQLKRIGVDEVACLIDYGIAAETVLEGLFPLAEVVRRANDAPALDPEDFSIAAQILRHGVTHMQATPSMARMIAMSEEGRSVIGQVGRMMLGGEPVPGALVAEMQALGVATVEAMYGPTETTVWSSTGPADGTRALADLGRPIANTRFYVLDGAGQPVPPGLPGELWIGGAGVARGYLNLPDLSADRFRPDPFAGEGRIYGTGDLVRALPDGRLEFLGRADGQVKLRGYRIELGEVEAAAAALPGVAEAVAMLREDQPGDARLVLYIRGEGVAAEGLRAALAQRLPAHMVPAHVVGVAAFPLTPNRKLDRRALPAPAEVAAAAAAAGYEAPVAGSIAERVAEVWARVLGVARVGARDSFFALGGHSLLAVQAHRELRGILGDERLAITDIFRFPVLADYAAHVDRRAGPAAERDAAAEAAARAAANEKRRALRAARAV
ncbi:MAG: LLM class flavin-dependent oxidoreductase [Rhodobacteraceae bacterium]|nr:LLM class flavin-dependent oxidoreductase [Paracoccaceae bacterium]